MIFCFFFILAAALRYFVVCFWHRNLFQWLIQTLFLSFFCIRTFSAVPDDHIYICACSLLAYFQCIYILIYFFFFSHSYKFILENAQCVLFKKSATRNLQRFRFRRKFKKKFSISLQKWFGMILLFYSEDPSIRRRNDPIRLRKDFCLIESGIGKKWIWYNLFLVFVRIFNHHIFLI